MAHMPSENTSAVSPVAPDQARTPNFCDYGVGMIENRLKKLLAHTEGAKSGQDTNAIHQMRVWSRRSRAALDVFGMCFTGKTAHEFARMEQEVKRVTRALGAARDLDVMLETLGKLGESLPAEQRSGVESFATHLQAQRAERQTDVRDAVQRLEGRDLYKSLQHMAHRQGYQAITLSTTQPDKAAAEGKEEKVKEEKEETNG